MQDSIQEVNRPLRTGDVVLARDLHLTGNVVALAPDACHIALVEFSASHERWLPTSLLELVADVSPTQ
jgi:hypothetical protein